MFVGSMEFGGIVVDMWGVWSIWVGLCQFVLIVVQCC